MKVYIFLLAIEFVEKSRFLRAIIKRGDVVVLFTIEDVSTCMIDVRDV